MLLFSGQYTPQSFSNPHVYNFCKAQANFRFCHIVTSKLVIAGLWTEVCAAFSTLDALRAGYNVNVVADVIGVSRVAH